MAHRPLRLEFSFIALCEYAADSVSPLPVACTRFGSVRISIVDTRDEESDE